ncbi:uncharacterized protein LOC116245225 [Nymphaea colorata]|uniref:Uncharacterized protein n=1 Tax=Nymphaea colorata TaxID=210225 RepID=A0A5K1HEB6_9MAGN|nr:uncharacterized protein LOC116245225 [Nymphaea colorata]VVW86136.1 unnamed protein product [Nymphaea colorata]
MNTPLICSFKPIKISKGLDDNEIIDIKAGGEFSVVVSRSRLSDSFEVHTFGCNLKGQLGIGEIRHVRNVTKVEALSNFTLKRNGKQEKVQVKQLACGNTHCIALLNIGYIMEWGDNEHGQMGNKKRSPAYSPIIVREFSEKDILGVFAGHNASGVILREEPPKKA